MSKRKTYEPKYYFGEELKCIVGNVVLRCIINEITIHHNSDNIVTYIYEVITPITGKTLKKYEKDLYPIDELIEVV